MTAMKPNAVHLARWSLVGAFTAASSFFLTFAPIAHQVPSHPGLLALNWANRNRLMVVFLPLVGGLIIWYLANRRFSRGFADGVWSEAELEQVRSLLNRSVWMWTFVAFGTAALLAFCLGNTNSGSLFIVTTFPMHAISGLKRLLSPPKERDGLIRWRDSKPLRSEHWGDVGREEKLSP
jgi:hypothetical protein